MNHVITLCDRRQERNCPIVPGAVWRSAWALDDPQAVESPEEGKAAMHQIRDEIRRRVVEFVSQNA